MFDAKYSICYSSHSALKRMSTARIFRIPYVPQVFSFLRRFPSLVSTVCEHHWYLFRSQAKTVDRSAVSFLFLILPWWNKSCTCMDNSQLNRAKSSIVRRIVSSYHRIRSERPLQWRQWFPLDWYTVQYWRIRVDSRLEMDFPISKTYINRSTRQLMWRKEQDENLELNRREDRAVSAEKNVVLLTDFHHI